MNVGVTGKPEHNNDNNIALSCGQTGHFLTPACRHKPITPAVTLKTVTSITMTITGLEQYAGGVNSLRNVGDGGVGSDGGGVNDGDKGGVIGSDAKK